MVSTGALTVSRVYLCACVCLCARHSLLAELDSKASEVSPEQCDISVLCIFLFVTSSACAHRSILQLERVCVCVSVQKCVCVCVCASRGPLTGCYNESGVRQTQ